jgi:uncharacterized phage-associated protein
MSFIFDSHRASQLAAYLLSLSPGRRMNYMLLLKMLYLADRESLKEEGVPLTGDDAYALDYGPVLSKIYDLIRPTAQSRLSEKERAVWESHLATEGYDLVLKHPAGTDELSRYEKELLAGVHARCQAADPFDLSEQTHDFEEWRKNYVPRTAMHIPLDDILEAVGRKEDTEAIRQARHEEIAQARLFAG